MLSVAKTEQEIQTAARCRNQVENLAYVERNLNDVVDAVREISANTAEFDKAVGVVKAGIADMFRELILSASGMDYTHFSSVWRGEVGNEPSDCN